MTTDYGPEERHLLETTAGHVYADAVAHGFLSSEDPRLAGGSEHRAALNLLLDLGLLRLDSDSGQYVPVDPSEVQSRIVAPLGQEGAELITESARWAEVFASLGHLFRTSPRATATQITEIHGMPGINKFIDAVVNDCREELLTAQPHGRQLTPSRLALAEDRDVKALERGVKMRTLYQHSARHSSATRDYVAEVVSRGAEVRTLDEFFKRLIVVDRQVAIVPATEDRHVAIAIYNRSLIAYLVDIFERSWERAQPFNLSGGQAPPTIASDVRAMTIRMLVEGHSDPASAKRLGVSTRTYAGYIAQLKEEYGVQTRFQLGYAMGRDQGRREAAEIDDRPDDV